MGLPQWVGLVVFCLWGGARKIICVYILKAHGLRSMGLGAVRLFIRRPTQHSEWAYMFSVCGGELEEILKPICT